MSKRTYITSLTAVNNSNIVTVNDGTDLTNISPGDDLRIDGLAGEAVKAITATQIILERPWALANKTNVKGINVPTADDFREATKLLRDATVLTASNMSAVNDWTTQMGTVEFTDPAEPTVTYTVKTIRQLEQDAIVIIGSAVEDADRAEAARDAAIVAQNQAETHKNTAGVSAGTAATKASEAATSASTATTAANTATTKAAEAVVSASNALSEADRAEVEANKAMMAASALYSMPQAQFEAIRAQNNEKYAASGFVHFGKHLESTKVNNGLWVDQQAASANKMYLGRGINLISGNSKTNFPLLNIAGVTTSVDSIATALGWQVDIKLPQAPDGKTTYNKSTGVVTPHADAATAFAAQAADPTNIEVVINRVDMWGFEAWLEEVNTPNPYVYPNGLIQSQATTMDGITTSASARPVTYYAVFDGDTGSKGKGLNFFTLTDAQKKKVLGNHKNNLYYLDDGRLVQWRLRQRTIAGVGNGDWASVVAPASVEDLMFNTSLVATRIRPQGVSESSSAYNVGEPYIPFNNGAAKYVEANDRAIYYARNIAANDNKAVNGECYFLVCGTVNRLNQGAYHPSYNPSGTAYWRAAEQPYWVCAWHNNAGTRTKLSGEPTATSDCFTAALGSLGNGGNGNIGSLAYDIDPARPDKHYYDAIYTAGQGGVCRDMRYSAYGKTLEDFAEADQRVKNGTYRGFEKQVFTKIDTGGTDGAVSSFGIYYHDSLPTQGIFWIACFNSEYLVGVGVGSIQHLFRTSDNTILTGVVTQVNPTSIVLRRVGPDIPSWRYYDGFDTSDIKWIKAKNSFSSVGGSFLQTDVIGSPANILATPALANGWVGSWLPTLPDGVLKDFPVTRKSLTTTIHYLWSINNGASWTKYTPAFNATRNAIVEQPSSLEVIVVQYQAFAKQTEPADNSKVYGGRVGLGDVEAFCAMSPLAASLLGESLISKVIRSEVFGVQSESLTLLSVSFDRGTGKLFYNSSAAYVGFTRHTPLALGAPDNSSPAFKVLNYNVNINQQVVPHYAYTELKHNGTNWGDDGKVITVDYQKSKMDLNGNTVLIGTAKLKEPIGWVKNKD